MSSSAVFRNNNDISNWLKKNSSWKSNQKHASVSIFNCPVEFFASTTAEPEALEAPAESKVESDAPVARGLTCLTCGLRFGDVKEQQQHFKSDLHVVNARRKVRGLPPVATAEDDRSLFFEQEVALVRQKSNELEEELHNNGVVFHASSSSSSESESNEGEGEESDSEDAEEVNSVVGSVVTSISVNANNQKTDVSSKERGSRKGGGGGRRSKKQLEGDERKKGDNNEGEDEEDQSLALSNDKPGEYSDNCGRIHKKFNSHQGPVLYFTRSESEHKAADTQQNDTTHITPSTTSTSTSTSPLHWSVGISTALFPRNSIFATNDWVFTKPEGKSPWTATFESLTALKQNPMVAVLLLRSGRFSGAVFEGKTLLIHKNCRRYTIRGKAGGSQSSHDNKGGKAKSAGANMRRQGEMDLKSDIEQCIQLWQPLLQTCQLILVSAPKHMRNGSLFSVEQRKNTVTTAASTNESHPNKPASAASALSTLSSGPIAATMTALNQLSLTSPYVLHKEDPRIQYVPFLCDKPSLEECKKVFETATTVHFQGCSEEEEREREGAKQKEGEKNESKASTSIASVSTSTTFSQALPSLPPAVVPVAIKLPACAASKNIFSLLTSSCNPTVNQQKGEEELYEKVEAILKIVSGEDGDPATRLSLTQGYSPSAIVNMLENADSMNTMLHIVSTRGLSSLVPLFLSHGASPLLTDSHNRTPYFVAKDKNVRDAFRRFRAEEEDKWDWNAAGVGAALSEEAEQLQKQKEKEKKKKQQLRKKEEKKVEEETKRKEEEAARLEEIRIREEIKRLGSCSQCGASLIGKIGILSLTPDKKCCSADCMSKLKRKMTADAAMARFESARAASRK